MTVITRFAPSPTGFLHIGGARTALFNWLYARHHGGTFHLRIEDTDRQRSTQAAIDAIIDGLQWLGLQWDGDIVFQYARAARHREIAEDLVRRNQAYYCYATAEELQTLRDQAQAEGKVYRYPGTWRERDASDAPPGIPPVIRIKAPFAGEFTVHDKVQGTVTVEAKQLDDMVILRADGTPTYMLAVVVDDHDMGITDVIRGDDHLTNTFRQMMIYQAMGWDIPNFAHIPLIHGSDGAKLSKRHGALGVESYRELGYLPEALRNYLLRLGWSHGDEEIISTQQAVQWFDLGAVGKSPSRFDFTKLEHLNGHYMREADDDHLANAILPWLGPVDDTGKARLIRGMHGLKQRAKTLVELAENARLYVTSRPIARDEKAQELLDKGGKAVLAALLPLLTAMESWEQAAIEAVCRSHAENNGQKLGQIAQPLRAALSGKTTSPGIFEVMEILGKEETLGRMQDAC